MNVLGIDPGLGVTGYGLISIIGDKVESINYGHIKTSTKDDLALRLKIIFNKIADLIVQYNPAVISIEEIFYSNNVKSSLLLGHARGASIAAAAVKDIKVFEYSAKKIKQSWLA